MTNSTNPTNSTNSTNSTALRIAAAGLVAGPLCFGIGDILRRIVDSSTGTSVTRLTAAVGDHPGLWTAVGVLMVIAPLFFLPGLAGLILTTHGKGSRLTMIGGSLLGIGMVASVGHAVLEFSNTATYAAAHLPDSTLHALDRADDSVFTDHLVIALFVAGLLLGTLLLIVGLRRARRIPIWAAIAGVVYFVALNMSGPTMGVLELVASLAFYVPAALWLMRRSGSHLESNAPKQVPSNA